MNSFHGKAGVVLFAWLMTSFLVCPALAVDAASTIIPSSEGFVEWQPEDTDLDSKALDLPACNLIPTTKEEAEALGFRKGNPRSSGLYATEALPTGADLLDYMPPVGTQIHNDCAAFSLAYYGISYWHFRELAMDPTDNPAHIGSSAYIFNQANGCKDEGFYYLYAPVLIPATNGCAFLSDFNPSDIRSLPSIQTQLKALPQRAGTLEYVFTGNNSAYPGSSPVSNQEMENVKAYLAQGVPVIVGIPVYTSFQGITNAASTDYYPGPYDYLSEYVGGHAIMIAGYVDSSEVPGGGVFLLRNSWGTSWGADGDLLVSYSFIENYAWEAYPLLDFKDYDPSSYVMVRIEHPWRGALDVRVFVDDTLRGVYSPYLMSLIREEGWTYDNRDDIEAVIDITFRINEDTDSIRLEIMDHIAGNLGEVRQAVLVHEGQSTPFVFDSGTSIPDQDYIVGTIDLNGGGGGSASSGGGGGGCSLVPTLSFGSMLLVVMLWLIGKR